MKKTLLFIACFIMAAFYGNAQDQTEIPVENKRHCATMEHLEWMKQQDPTLEARMQAEEQKFNDYIATHQEELDNSKTTYTMPVVVHVVYKTGTTTGYVSAARVAEQITQTNSDWAGTNGRSMEQFNSSLRADCGITLCLAKKDPSGNATTGIDYVQTTVTSWSYDDKVKHASYGGADAWTPSKYLNIWVCNLGNSLCGYAQFPTSGINSTFGVVIHYQFFGLTGASAPYNKGGTTSHEFGHCFNLYHIWGDDYGSCSGTDNCNDTPNQASENYGTNSGVVTDACTTTSPGIMYMNFMDYSDDIDYANMTPNQKSRMQSAIASYLSGVSGNATAACSGTDVNDISQLYENTTVYPNPTQDEFNVSFSGNQQKDVMITVFNSVGEQVKEVLHNEYTDNVSFDISDLANGIYNVKIQTAEGSTFKKIILMK